MTTTCDYSNHSLCKFTNQNSSPYRGQCIPLLSQVNACTLRPAEVIQKASHLQPSFCDADPPVESVLLCVYVNTFCTLPVKDTNALIIDNYLL